MDQLVDNLKEGLGGAKSAPPLIGKSASALVVKNLQRGKLPLER